jgi:predicted nucleotidyltransferase
VLDEAALAQEVVRRHGAHTVLLYGSRARGDATPTSDVDLIALRSAGGPLRDVTPWHGFDVDLHVFDDAGVDALVAERAPSLAHARVLVQRGDAGSHVVTRVRTRLAEPPPELPRDEWVALWAWGGKMRGRLRDPDPTFAAYRRAEVLRETLPAWCQVRRRWYLGAKPTLRSIAEVDSTTHVAYVAAARADAPITALDRLLACVFDVQAAGQGWEA